jgi:hypothetical protein
VEGIIGHLLIEKGSTGESPDNLAQEVKNHLSLNDTNAQQLVGEAIGVLHKDGLCGLRDNDTDFLVWTGGDNDSYKSAIDTLVNSTVNRYVVRE